METSYEELCEKDEDSSDPIAAIADEIRDRFDCSLDEARLLAERLWDDMRLGFWG